MFDMVRLPGFEPGSLEWQSNVLTRLDYSRNNDNRINIDYIIAIVNYRCIHNFKFLIIYYIL